MSNDKFHYPQRSPPPEKNIPRVKRWGEVGFTESRQKIKIVPPCHNSKRSHPLCIVHHRIRRRKTAERLAACQVIAQRKIIPLRACICVATWSEPNQVSETKKSVSGRNVLLFPGVPWLNPKRTGTKRGTASVTGCSRFNLLFINVFPL